MYGIEDNPDLAVPDDSFIASSHRPSGNVFFPLRGLCSWASGTCPCVDGGTRSLDPLVSAFLMFCLFLFYGSSVAHSGIQPAMGDDAGECVFWD